MKKTDSKKQRTDRQTVPKYVEPDDYFPEEIRRKFKLGEFAELSEPETKVKTEHSIPDASKSDG